MRPLTEKDWGAADSAGGGAIRGAAHAAMRIAMTGAPKARTRECRRAPPA
jgi:hypothetical protein